MKSHPNSHAFTLVEVIVVAGILVVLMTVLVSMTNSTQILLRGTSAKIEQFQEARVGFESMTRKLAQATLNSFWDYQYPNGDTSKTPDRYVRNAELRFRSGQMLALTGGVAANGNLQPGHGVFFNAPLGFVDDLNTYGVLDNLINTWGYFVELGDDTATLPAFLTTGTPPLVNSRTRYRLMELMQPSEQLAVYTPTAQVAGNTSWFDTFATGAGLPSGINRPVRVLAENVIALVILPRLSKTDEDTWMATTGNTSASNPTPPPLTLSNTPPTGSSPNGYSYDTTITTISDPILNPRNQLPPVVQIVMVAIDEPSALRLQDKFGPTGLAPDPKLGIDYGNLFLEPPTNQALLNPTQLTDDIAELENRLIAKRVSYRVFSTNVSIRGAKWSKAQAN